MKTRPQPSAFFLVGPTAVGKTSVAQWIAERRGCDVLSADSMLVYRGMDIGTAKPDPRERGLVRYWGIDVAGPDERFSAGSFRRVAADAVERCRADGRELVVAGGTGLYIMALVKGLDALPPGNPRVRAEGERLLAEGGVPALQAAVRAAAPARFAVLKDPCNPRRLVRALELGDAGLRARPGADRPAAMMAGLRMPAALLADRIRARVARMFAGGLLDEARALKRTCEGLSETARHAIGYAEAFAAVEGRCSVDEAVERTVVRTRQLARRQMTWFRHQAAVSWIDVEPGMTTQQAAEAVMDIWSKHGPTPLEL